VALATTAALQSLTFVAGITLTKTTPLDALSLALLLLLPVPLLVLLTWWRPYLTRPMPAWEVARAFVLGSVAMVPIILVRELLLQPQLAAVGAPPLLGRALVGFLSLETVRSDAVMCCFCTWFYISAYSIVCGSDSHSMSYLSACVA
jgi:RsiW-degrading membrane proteinase PrsW (M82 family)